MECEHSKNAAGTAGTYRSGKMCNVQPDGRMVITGSADNTALIWDASRGEVLAKIEGSIIETGPAASDTAAQIYAATFSPDSKRVLLLTTPDQAARIYSWNIFVPAQQLLSLAPKLAPREFTCEERQIY